MQNFVANLHVKPVRIPNSPAIAVYSSAYLGTAQDVDRQRKALRYKEGFEMPVPQSGATTRQSPNPVRVTEIVSGTGALVIPTALDRRSPRGAGSDR